LELTAGELTAELIREEEAKTVLGADLSARLIADGEAVLRAQRVAGSAEPVASVKAAMPGAAGAAAPTVKSAATRWRERSAWMLAAAATVAWFLIPNPLQTAPEQATPIAALREALTADSTTVTVAWAPSTDPAGRAASGDVVWHAASQRGVLRFRGLAPNDPRTAQYQLWIVDGDRDARYPVDGGVFDVTAEGEVLIPIDARLPVGRATLFAVTLEAPGGVVVSTRERLVLAAPVG
jgi:anti-sigma-K factor RskA